MTKSSVFIFPIAAVFSLLFLTSNAFAQSGSPCNAHLSGSAPAAGYGAAWNPLTSAKELLLSATCTTAGAPVSYTVGVGTATHYVHKVDYVDAASWQPFTMTGTFAQGSTDWLSGRGTYTNPSPPATDYFWVRYICQWTRSEWKCGCRDAACATNYWQLQQVKYPVPGGTTGGTTGETRGGSTGGGVTRGGAAGNPLLLDRIRNQLTVSGNLPYLPYARSGSDGPISVKAVKTIPLDGDATINSEGRVAVLNVDSDAQFEFVHLNDNRIMRAYDDNGKKLWEINNPSGGVARDGGHSPAVVTWDFDGDGRDDIVHCWTNKLTIRVGATGAVMHSVPIPNLCTDLNIDAYMMESGPSPIILIGQKTTGNCPKGNFGPYWAHTYAYDSKLTPLWNKYTCAAGHMTHGVDEDADGKAESIFVGKYKFGGAGNVLCLLEGKVAGNDDHTDSLAIGEANPNNPGFEVAEVGATGSGIFSARTCKKLWNGNLHQTQKSTMADLYPQYPGAEILFAQRPVCANNRCDDRIYQILKGDGTLLKQFASFGTGVGSMPIANTNLDMKGGDEVLTSNGTFIRKDAAIAISNAWQKPYTGVNTHIMLLNILNDDRPELIGHGGQGIFVMQVQ